MSLNATSTQCLNTSRDGDSTISLGSLCQSVYYHSVCEESFLLPNLNLPSCNLRLFCLILSLLPGRRGRPPSLQFSFMKLLGVIRFPEPLLQQGDCHREMEFLSRKLSRAKPSVNNGGALKISTDALTLALTETVFSFPCLAGAKD